MCHFLNQNAAMFPSLTPNLAVDDDRLTLITNVIVQQLNQFNEVQKSNKSVQLEIEAKIG